MHRTAALLAALALVVSGCGGSGSGSAAPTTPVDHTQAPAQRELLAKALAEFKRAPSGTYESEVTADGVSQPIAHENGSYRLRPPAAAYERAIAGIDPTSRKVRVQVVRVRGTANGRWFLQLKEWGSWTGCWMSTDAPTITKLTGVATAKDSRLPTAIAVLARATVVGAGNGMSGPHLAVDAYSALQFLGVAAAAIEAERDVFTQTRVPVLLDVTANGSPAGAAVVGTQVVSALKAADVPVTPELSKFVSKTRARVVLGELGQSVTVAAPAAAELLPRNPAATSTCPANR